MEAGEFKEAAIGIYAYDKEVVRYLQDLKIDTGIYVASINKTGAAYGKGLLVGDIITKIDNVTLNKVSDLRKYIYTKEIGDEVMLTVNRRGRTFEISLKLENK